jgi:hypothetical protein
MDHGLSYSIQFAARCEDGHYLASFRICQAMGKLYTPNIHNQR